MGHISKDEPSLHADPVRAARPASKGATMSEDPEYPYVVKADVGRLPDGSIGLKLTVAASEEAYNNKAWNEVAYLLGPATARELAASLEWR
jgi:hypothetical protein